MFENSTGSSHPFRIQFARISTGVGTYVMEIRTEYRFLQSHDAPASYEYVCTIHGGMKGSFIIPSYNMSPLAFGMGKSRGTPFDEAPFYSNHLVFNFNWTNGRDLDIIVEFLEPTFSGQLGERKEMLSVLGQQTLSYNLAEIHLMMKIVCLNPLLSTWTQLETT